LQKLRSGVGDLIERVLDPRRQFVRISQHVVAVRERVLGVRRQRDQPARGYIVL
jgi:hypothetical protein